MHAAGESMNENGNDVLCIVGAGLSSGQRALLRTTLKLLAADGIRFTLSCGEPDDAHLLVLDDGTEEGRRVFAASRSGQVKLVLSDEARVGPNLIVLKRPVEIVTLKKVLARLFAKMQPQIAVPSAATSPPQDMHEDAAPPNSVFHLLLEVKRKREVLRLTLPEGTDVFVDGLNRSLATVAPAQMLHEMVRLPVSALRVERLAASEFAVISSGLNVSTLNGLLWTAAVHCSGGRLLPGHRMDTPVRLRAWPNFTRTDFRPEHLRLAAKLAMQSLSLSELAEHSGVPEAEVIAFYNAGVAVDLIDTAPGGASEGGAVRPADEQKRGLLSRIAERLTLRR